MTHLLCQCFGTAQYQHLKELAGSKEAEKTTYLPTNVLRSSLQGGLDYNHSEILQSSAITIIV